ncbi:MAG: DDE-type integrase/transposase/recombinase [Candidatus Bathyarchaeia archaeon]|jgi:hypothetical protein
MTDEIIKSYDLVLVRHPEDSFERIITHYLRPLFQQGKKLARKQPKTLITDGAPNFHEAFKDEFWTQKLETRPEHIRDIRMNGEVHNNKMERMNGEIRDRERVMRTLEKTNSPILTGIQIFHNYVRPHMALDEKTSAEVAGIKVEGDDKWMTLIQNASWKNHGKPINKS